MEWKIKKLGLCFRSTEQISFSELYMERSTKRSKFFQKVKNLDSLGRDGERNKKNISKRPGNKSNLLTVEYRYLTMMLLSKWYDLSDVGTEELVKEALSCMRFCVF
ncbi:MAG: hypothetical protein ACMUEL_02265 [Flavobacteriales bacterium Tduv]